MGESISEVENSVNDLTPLLEEKGNVSGKTIQIDNRKTVSSNGSSVERLVLLAIQKAEDLKPDEFQDLRSEPGSIPIDGLGKHLQLVETETRSNRPSLTSKTSSDRRALF